MRLGLHVIARIFDWTDEDIQINELLNYSKNIIENNAMTNNRRFLSNTSTASSVMRQFVILIHDAQPHITYCTPFTIVNTKAGVTHESFEAMARYWNRIKKRLNDDNAFRIAFEQAINNYQISERKHPCPLKTF